MEKEKTVPSLSDRLLMCYQVFEAVRHLEVCFPSLILSLTAVLVQKIGYCHRDIKPDNIFVKNTCDGPPLVLLGEWGCATDKLKFMNEEPTGRYDLRKGNGAYCPPEIVNAGRGKELDYSRADSWSMALIALGKFRI